MESHKFDVTDAIRRRLIYRSKQRGWLELDIMLGDWSSENLKNMGPEELSEYEALLDQENPDLFKWLTGQLEAPEELQGPVFQQLMQHVSSTMLSSAAGSTRTAEEWSSRKWWTEEITEEMREK